MPPVRGKGLTRLTEISFEANLFLTRSGGHRAQHGRRSAVTDSTDSRSSALPPKANLEFLRKQAKQLARSSADLKLTDAQHQIAKSYGFASWPKLVSQFEELEPSAGDREDSSEGYESDSRPGPDIYRMGEDDLRGLAPAIESGEVATIASLFDNDNGRGDPITFWLRRYHGNQVDAFLNRNRERLTPHLASAFDQVDSLQSMIEKDPSVVDQQNQQKRTLLDLAAHEGHSRCVQFLLQSGADPNKRQPLYYAAQNGYLGPARLLLDAGADINHPEESPLGRAVYRNRPEMVKLLIEQGAKLDPDILNGAAYGSRCKGKLHILQYLVDHGADTNYRDSQGFNALYSQISYFGSGPDRAITKFLIHSGCEVNLHSAAGLDLTDPIETMLTADPSRANEPLGDFNWTPLHFAARGGALNTAEKLLARGANARAQADHGKKGPNSPNHVLPHQLVVEPDGHYRTRDTSKLKRLLMEAAEG